jgi:hypothetical protein
VESFNGQRVIKTSLKSLYLLGLLLDLLVPPVINDTLLGVVRGRAKSPPEPWNLIAITSRENRGGWIWSGRDEGLAQSNSSC